MQIEPAPSFTTSQSTVPATLGPPSAPDDPIQALLHRATVSAFRRLQEDLEHPDPQIARLAAGELLKAVHTLSQELAPGTLDALLTPPEPGPDACAPAAPPTRHLHQAVSEDPALVDAAPAVTIPGRHRWHHRRTG